jgi:hypothetical protein
MTLPMIDTAQKRDRIGLSGRSRSVVALSVIVLVAAVAAAVAGALMPGHRPAGDPLSALAGVGVAAAAVAAG